MRATLGRAFLALAAIALGGCTTSGVQPVTEAPAASPTATTISLATPTSAGTAASMVALHSDELLGVIERFKDQGCAYGRTGMTCRQDRSKIHRLVDQMRADLDDAAPVAADVDALAKRTSRRLAAVSTMTADTRQGGSLLDTELTSLVEDLKSWSTVTS